MKTLGLLGGMSWESTQHYYRLINRGVQERLGKLHSARLVLWSVDFQEIEELQHAGRWNEAGRILAQAAQRLETAGADLLLICTNTMHRVADQVSQAVSLPLLHLADATGEAIRRRGLDSVGLLGTRFTMEENFYRGRLESGHGLEVLVPPEEDRATVHRVIYEELCLGTLREESRAEYVRIVADLEARGAQGVIAGCTEIGLLLEQRHVSIPLFDTTEIHAEAAVAWALPDEA